MYVIVPSKPGVYKSSIKEHAKVKRKETYQYYFYGDLKAVFSLVEIDNECYIEIIEEEPPFIKNSISTKFLDHFDSIEEAKNEINYLVTFGNLDTSLRLIGDPIE